MRRLPRSCASRGTTTGHPEFLTLVNSENLHRARHLKTSEAIRQTSGRLVAMVKSILDRGVAAGVFRSGVDPVQLNITIAAIGYYYLNQPLHRLDRL